MITLIVDEYEFDSPCSEESLEINIAARNYGSAIQFRDVNEFAVVCVGAESAAQIGVEQSYDDQAAYSSIRNYLKRFANIDVPDPCPWNRYELYTDALEWDGILETPELFIRYHWTSTA